MKNYLLVFFLLIGYFSDSQILPPKQAYSFNIKQLHSGHSLTDPLFHPWPGQYRYLVHDMLKAPFENVTKSTIPGSPMRYRWENQSLWGEPSARHNIRDWELLVITESVPLHYDGGGNQQWYVDRQNEQRNYLSIFANNAWENGNQGKGTPTLLWTTWTNINNENGPWRPLLDTYEKEWEAMQDFANSKLPQGATPIYIVPGHRMMARLYDDIQKNIVPGINNINQFFSDNIHLNEKGSYAAAMIHYACLFNKSPEGLPNNLYTSMNANSPSPALANYLQKMIWEVVTSYPRTGVIDASTSIQTLETVSYYPFPNPASNTLRISETIKNPVSHIFDSLGNVVLSSYGYEIEIGQLPKGTYYIDINNVKKAFIKL
jgi:hypothetical protein